MAKDKSTTLNFDASKVEQYTGAEALSAGWKLVTIADSEVVETKDGNGLRLKLTLKVSKVQNAPESEVGRSAFIAINIENANATAQEIGQKMLSSICHVTGVLRPKNTTSLHGKPFWIKLKVRTQEGFEPSNEPTGFKNVNDAPTDAATAEPSVAVEPGADWQPDAEPTPSAPPAPARPAPKPVAKPTPVAAKPAAPAKPAPPKAPAKPAAPAPKPKAQPAEPKYWLSLDGADPELVTESEVKQKLAEGMDPDAPLCLDGTEDWKTAADFGIEAEGTTEAAPWAT